MSSKYQETLQNIQNASNEHCLEYLKSRHSIKDVFLIKNAPLEAIQGISSQSHDTETAILLNGGLGIGDIVPFPTLIAYNLKEALKEHFKVKGLEIYIIMAATRGHLEAALNNEQIQHVAVYGHGAWDRWKDHNGERVDNKKLKKMNSEERKKSFVRLTCGMIPDITTTFEDQLGTPFAHEIFGRAAWVMAPEFVLRPLFKTDPEFVEKMALYTHGKYKIQPWYQQLAEFYISSFTDLFKIGK